MLAVEKAAAFGSDDESLLTALPTRPARVFAPSLQRFRRLAVVGAVLSLAALLIFCSWGRSAAVTAHLHGRAAEAISKNDVEVMQFKLEPTMYCVSSLMLHTYEHNIFKSLLFQGQEHRIGLGIFGCDGFDVFSARKVLLGHHYEKGPVHTVRYRQAPVGTSFSGNAANAELFVNMWSEVRRRGHSLRFDWTVKVDPDTVLFAERLRTQLRQHTLSAAQKPVFLTNCNGGAYYSASTVRPTRLPSSSDEEAEADGQNATDEESGAAGASAQNTTDEESGDAEADTQNATQRGSSDAEADKQNATRGEMSDEEAMAENATDQEIGEAEAFTENASHAYFHSKSHLYGALEAFSRKAMHVYFRESSSCQGSLIHKMGEDEYMGMCLSNFGIPVPDLDLIADAVCRPCTCEKFAAAYHPYKSVTDWWACWQKAFAV